MGDHQDVAAGSRRLRPLGFFEQLLALEHEHVGERCTVLGVTLVEGRIDGARASDAARALWTRHPLLRASIYRREDGVGHELRDGVPFAAIPVVTRRGSIESGWAEAEALLHAALPQSTCLWRITLVSEGEGPEGRHLVLLVAHHTICDGLSILRLMTEFLELVEIGGADVEPLPLLAPVEALLTKRRTWVDYQQGRRALAARQAERSPLPVARRAPLGERMHRNFFETLSEEDTADLVARCRANRTTVTGALHAALALAAIEAGCSGKNVPFLVPVSLLGRCTPPIGREHVGCYVSTFELVLAAEVVDFWELARRATRAIQDALPDVADTPVEFPLDELTEMPGTSPDIDTACFESGYCISNVGPTSGPSGALTKVRGMWFASNRHTGDIALLLSVCTVEGQLHVCYSYTEPLLERQTARRLALGSIRRLRGEIA